MNPKGGVGRGSPEGSQCTVQYNQFGVALVYVYQCPLAMYKLIGCKEASVCYYEVHLSFLVDESAAQHIFNKKQKTLAIASASESPTFAIAYMTVIQI